MSRITKRKQARRLLGRQVDISFRGDKTTSKTSSLTGTIMAVRNLHSTELGRSVHVRFDTVLEEKEMMDIVDGK